MKYINGDFIVNLDSTLRGINLFRKIINKQSPNKEPLEYLINIWDIKGSENYIDFVKLLSEPIDAIIIQTNANEMAIQQSVKKWLKLLEDSIDIEIMKFLIISKRNNLPIDKVILRNIVLDYDLKNYYTIDSKNTEQVNGAFENIFNEIIPA